MPKKGYQQTDVHRQRIAIGHKGLKRTAAQRRRMSLAQTGVKRKWSKEARQRMKQTQLKRYERERRVRAGKIWDQDRQLMREWAEEERRLDREHGPWPVQQRPIRPYLRKIRRRASIRPCTHPLLRGNVRPCWHRRSLRLRCPKCHRKYCPECQHHAKKKRL